MSTRYELELQAGDLGASQAQDLVPYNQQALQWYYNPCPYSSTHCAERDFELVIEEVAKDSEPRLDFGPKLRLLIADPIRGIDLREAIAKLKIALREAYEQRN